MVDIGNLERIRPFGSIYSCDKIEICASSLATLATLQLISMSKSNSYICQCKAVYRNEILNAVRRKGAQTLSDVQVLTKASTGCGRCKSQVLHILDNENSRLTQNGLQLRLDL